MRSISLGQISRHEIGRNWQAVAVSPREAAFHPRVHDTLKAPKSCARLARMLTCGPGDDLPMAVLPV